MSAPSQWYDAYILKLSMGCQRVLSRRRHAVRFVSAMKELKQEYEEKSKNEQCCGNEENKCSGE